MSFQWERQVRAPDALAVDVRIATTSLALLANLLCCGTEPQHLTITRSNNNFKSFLALRFCVGIYLRKVPKATNQAGVPALSLEAELPLEGIYLEKIQLMRFFIQCFYLVLIGEIPTLFYPDSSEIPPASQELLIRMEKRGGSGLLPFWSD